MSNTIAEMDQSHIELDSHASMPVVGRHSYVVSDHMGEVHINPCSPDYDPICVQLVDAIVQ